jgi:hypothetical protein
MKRSCSHSEEHTNRRPTFHLRHPNMSEHRGANDDYEQLCRAARNLFGREIQSILCSLNEDRFKSRPLCRVLACRKQIFDGKAC